MVENVGDGFVGVVMKARGACEGCKARNVCGMDEGGERRIIVYTDQASSYAAGEQVTVSIGKDMGMKAVTVAYIYPFILMLAVLLTALGFGAGELAAGLSSLGSLAVYFFAVWLMRRRFDKEIVFSIRKS